MSAPPLLRWAAPGPYEVAFSTRRGGVSEGIFASLNLGRKTGDDPARVDENRRLLCAAVGADHRRLALNHQYHSATVTRARPGVLGVRGDGLWTDERRVPLLALTADCLPVAVVRSNGDRPGVAALHAGRMGVLAGVLEAGVAALGAGRVAAAIGPAIGPCCYEVGDDIRAAYRARFGRRVIRGRRLDLWSAGEQALREAGCSSVQRFDVCTACNPELVFSYHRDGTPRGDQGVIAFVA